MKRYEDQKRYEVFGRLMTLNEMAADPRCVVGFATLKIRLVRGTSPEDAMTRRTLRQSIMVGDRELTQKEYLAETGSKVSLKKFNRRLQDDIDVERAITNGDLRETDLLTAWGESKTITEWSRDERCNCTIDTLAARLKHGTAPTVEEAISCPSWKKKVIIAWEQRKSISDWAADGRCRVSFGTLWQRLKAGILPEKAISTPPDVAEMRNETMLTKGWLATLFGMDRIVKVLEEHKKSRP